VSLSAAQELRKQSYRGTNLRDSKGIYTWKDERFPSVTTIIKQLDKPALPRWASRSVAEYVAAYCERVTEEKLLWPEIKAHLSNVDKIKNVPWDYAEQRRDLGSNLHDLAERYVGGSVIDPRVFGSDIRPYVESFLKFQEEFGPEYLAMECGVFNRTHNYAGTLDCIVSLPKFGPVLWVGDYKVSKDTWPEHRLQLAALAHAEFIGLADGTEIEMPKVERGFNLLIGDAGYRLMEWPIGDHEFDAFLHLRGLRDFTTDGIKPVEVKP